MKNNPAGAHCVNLVRWEAQSDARLFIPGFHFINGA